MAAKWLMTPLALSLALLGGAVSPVQKVVELLEQCKAKVASDLAAEAKAMEEYTTFCDDELQAKGYAIKTAESQLMDLEADIEDAAAQISELEEEITMLGTEIAAKDKELTNATMVREAAHEVFVSSEKELLASIDELASAISVMKQGMVPSFAQVGRRGPEELQHAADALGRIIEAEALDAGSRRKLQSFLQATQEAADGEDDDLSFTAKQQPKVVAIESHAGGILETLEGMQEKAEDTLSELRQAEMEKQHSFEMVSSGLEDELKHGKDKLATATKNKASSLEDKGQAEQELTATKKTKAGDEAYSADLKAECEETSTAWADRQKSAKDEMGAIDKAKEILVGGVKAAFVEVSAKTKSRSHARNDDDDDDDKDAPVRAQLSDLFRKLGQERHSFALAQLASAATSDPFVKVRGLIEDMMTKLINEANEDATHEAFCQEEMGKSKKSQEEKTASMDKYSARIESAETTMATLTEAIKTLEAEIAEIDRGQTEATKLRTEEHTEYLKASKDFRDSAEAVARAIEVLKSYYEGASLVQVGAHKASQPAFGSAKGDTAHTIISVLEMSEEDFTRLLAETEGTEEEAAKAYEKLTQENKVSRASKEAEAKAKSSEVKSLTVELEHAKEDHGSVKEELDAVLEYLDKLKPECESKAMSYEERKQAREAEITGLKEALSILEGKGLALLQRERRNLRAPHRK